MNILCFDIGGTAVKYGVWQEGEITQVGDFPTPKTWTLMKNELLEVYQKFEEIDGIGFSSPGSVDIEKGIIKGISAISYIHNFSIVEELEQLFDRKVSIENDANCAALAELYFGNAKELENVAFFIIGSGIGGAISVDKKLVKGANLFGGEIGYMLLDEKNTVSHLASPVQVAKRYGNISGKKLFELATEGNQKAQETVEGIYDALARSMYNVCLLIDPQKILIGGAISQREDIIEPIQAKLDQYLKNNGAGDLKITIDKCYFNKNANLVGAAVNYLNRYQ